MQQLQLKNQWVNQFIITKCAIKINFWSITFCLLNLLFALNQVNCVAILPVISIDFCTRMKIFYHIVAILSSSRSMQSSQLWLLKCDVDNLSTMIFLPKRFALLVLVLLFLIRLICTSSNLSLCEIQNLLLCKFF